MIYVKFWLPEKLQATKTGNTITGQPNPGKHLEFLFISGTQTIKLKIASLQQSKGNQSHKGGCLQEALILLNVTILGVDLMPNCFEGVTEAVKSKPWPFTFKGWFA